MRISDADEIEDHDLGLFHDLPVIVERDRRLREGREGGSSPQMASVTGSVDEGYTISLDVPV